MKNLIYYVCKTQFENTGDLLINKLLITELRKYGKVVVNDRKIPLYFLQELGLFDNERSSNGEAPSLLLTLVQLMITFNFLTRNRKIYLVLTPGHFFSGKKQQGFIRRVGRVFGYYGLKLLNVKICRFGSSLGPFSNMDLLTHKFISKSMLLNAVREEYSYRYAVDNEMSNVKRSFDLAFLLEKKNVCPLHELGVQKKYVIMSFREGVMKTQLRHHYLENAIHLIVKYFTGIEKTQIVFTYQVESDKEFMEFIFHKYKKNGNVLFINRRLHLHETFAIYSNAELVFSNRLHVLLIAMSQEVVGLPIIDRKSHVKISGIYELIKKDNLIVDLNCFEKIDDIINVARYEKLNNSIKNIFHCTKIKLENDISSIFNSTL